MKKTLSVILSVLMVLSVLSVAVFAAPSSLKIEGQTYFYVPTDYKIDAANFSVSFIVKTDKLVDLSGSVTPENCLVSAEADPYTEYFSQKYYFSDGAEAFADYVNNYATEEATDGGLFDISSLIPSSKGKKVMVDYTLTVANENVIGTADYTLSVTGLYKGELSDSTTFITASTKNTAVIDKIKTAEITGVDAQTAYKDNEDFVINEATANITTEAGLTGVIKASENPALFIALPVGSEKLTVNTKAVDVTVYGAECEPFTVKGIAVDHAWGEKFASLSKDYHATVCEGCGEANPATKAEHHFGEPEYNNDQTFFKDGTQSSVCADCGAVHTELVEGTAGYCEKFANYKFLYVICDYISLIFDFITGIRIING